MSKLNEQWIEAFRAGDYGDKGVYTSADLQAIASSYDPKVHEAPIVVGHPADNAPAFGWIEAAKVEGDVLLVKPRQVHPAFEQAVKDGLFKKRSIALYQKFGAAGTPYLRHIGFLGAMPPEVKGLADVQFAAQPEFREIEFNEKETEMDKQSLMDSLREFFGSDKPKLFTEAQVAERVAEAEKPLKAKLAEFGELTPADKTKMADMQKTVDAMKAKMAEGDTRKTTAITLAETAVRKLKDARKWIPAYDKMGLPQLFAELAAAPTTITFGEGDKKKEKPVLDVFAEFIGAIRQIVPEGEIVSAGKLAGKGGTVIKFNETARLAGDPDSVLFLEAAQARAKENKIELGAAMKELRAEGWIAAQTGSATAGAV